MERQLTWKDKRTVDGGLCAIVAIVGGLAFGIWQHSIAAGFFAALCLERIGNIHWAIEYGAHLPHNLGEPTKVEYSRTSETKAPAYGRWDTN
jgi:hypothetical protein